jgi:hypothetical protein
MDQLFDVAIDLITFRANQLHFLHRMRQGIQDHRQFPPSRGASARSTVLRRLQSRRVHPVVDVGCRISPARFLEKGVSPSPEFQFAPRSGLVIPALLAKAFALYRRQASYKTSYSPNDQQIRYWKYHKNYHRIRGSIPLGSASGSGSAEFSKPTCKTWRICCRRQQSFQLRIPRCSSELWSTAQVNGTGALPTGTCFKISE